MGRYRQPDRNPATQAEIAKFRQTLDDAGLREDVGEDEGAAALKRATMENLGIDPDALDERVRLYWLTHVPAGYGEHKQLAQQFAAEVLDGKEWNIDEDYVKSIQEEVVAAERYARLLKRENAGMRERKLIDGIQKKFPKFSEKVIFTLLDKMAA